MLYLLKLVLSGALLCSSFSFTQSHPELANIHSKSLSKNGVPNSQRSENWGKENGVPNLQRSENWGKEDWDQKDFNFDFDSVSFDEDEDDLFMNEYLDTTGMDRICRTINPAEIMVILNLLGVPSILQEPLFLHTNILNKRSLLDQPIFEPDRPEFPGKWVVGLNAFARKTTRSNFTRNSDRIDSWVALSQDSLIRKLERAVDNANILSPGIELDVAEIFALFENMTIEERQVGFMIHGMKRWRNVTLRIMAPLYYQESNFSLTKKEQDEVARVLGALDPEEEKKFRKAHFISDKIGFGDTRLEVDGTVINRPSYKLRVGGLATVPTAFTWGAGFLGSSFAKPSTLPTFELEPLFSAIENPNTECEAEAQRILRAFIFDAFDRVAADLIDVPLGNRGHLGLGMYTRSKIPFGAFFDTWFAQRLKIASRMSIELFLPAREKRFYINRINEQAFASHNFQDLDAAAQNVQFLKEQAISRLFLRAFDTRIVPGVIFRWNSGLYYKGDIFGFNLGLDYWLQNKARISSISVLTKTLQELDIPKAKQPVAQQSKIFGAFLFKIKADRCTYFFSINADASLNTKGLGQDYSVALNFESSF
jgi:hypothetical protein